jgi:transcriptional regulator with XRE-family HTH domain
MDIVLGIKKEADNQKISLAEIARRLDMTPQNFNHILKSESVKFRIVQQIASILEVSIDYLLEEKKGNINYGNAGNDINQDSIKNNHNSNNHYSTISGISEEIIVRNLKTYESMIESQQKIIEKQLEENLQLINLINKIKL